ncbi:MAG: DinB family protein [Chitinophagales bacterium]
MYRKIEDFLSDWKHESDSTLKVFAKLQDGMLNHKVHEKVRTAGFLSWHITHTLKEMMERTGLSVDLKAQNDYNGETAKEIYESYKAASESLVRELAKWNDDSLQTEDEMYGEKWKRGVTLHILVTHQAHHRGQLEVIMRICGLSVPGVYGPSQEEWTQYGMPVMN